MKKTPNYYLAIVLAASPPGWFGAHHIYLGNKKRAVLYFLFSLSLIPALLAIFDSLIMLYRGQETFIRKYGNEQDLEHYHFRELQRHNPVLANQMRMSGYEPDGDIDYEELAEKMEQNDKQEQNNERKQNDEDPEEEQEETLEDNIQGEPDYSDYYGNW
jgi:TM2 domain-containing membrane protein YozV